jgi:hypothetical protein
MKAAPSFPDRKNPMVAQLLASTILSTVPPIDSPSGLANTLCVRAQSNQPTDTALVGEIINFAMKLSSS